MLMLPLTELEVVALQAENKKLKAENECLVNFFDRGRSLQCTLRHFLESTTVNGVEKAWGYLGLDVHRDYALLTTTLDCLPAFNISRDQMKDTLEGQIRRACDAERDLRNIKELAKELAEDIDLEGMKSDALTRYEAYVKMHP